VPNRFRSGYASSISGTGTVRQSRVGFEASNPRCPKKQFDIFTSSIRFPGIPEKTEAVDAAELCDTTFEITTLRAVPGRIVSFGPRFRRFSRRNSGASAISRMEIFEIAISSVKAPSAASSAIPFDPSIAQFEIVIFRNPPFDSVPHLIRPFRGTLASSANFAHFPASTLPSS
jgi:hypothetical protein